MTLPALLKDFPNPQSELYAERAALLSRQWAVCWKLGNNFFRPISTLSTLGYAVSAWSISQSSAMEKRDWRMFAVGALLHVSVILHSAINMQPLNDKLIALAGSTSDGKDIAKQDTGNAVVIAESWMKLNIYRAVIPLVTGAIGLWQTMLV